MAFKRKTDTGSGDQFKFETIGQKLTGYYLGSFDHDGEYGPTKKHVFKTQSGLKVVFGQTHLTQLLDGEKAGTLMRVTFSSEKKAKKGNPMKMYDLDIDTDQVLDASEIPDSSENAEEQEDEVAAGQYEDDAPIEEEEETPPMDEVKTAPAKNLAARTVTPDRKAKVDEILNRRRPAATQKAS